MVTVSVPGKVNLMGEHAIVHGYPAILAAVDLRMRVSVESSRFRVHGSRLEVISSESDKYVRQVVEVVQRELKIDKLPPMKITINSEIPAGYHLGSSAATAVGVTGALTYFLQKLWNPQRINEIAYEAEKLQHGTPSGGDNTAITFGGLMWFRKELEFLKSIWQLPFKPGSNIRPFFLLDTGRPVETTGEMIVYVKAKVIRQKAKVQKIFTINEEQVRRVTVALKMGDEAGLMEAIKLGERTLEEMGVVSQKARKIIRRIEEHGGAAKILGGGGRKDGVGFLLVYHPEGQKLQELATREGYKIRKVKLGEEGIRLESK